MVEVCTVFCYCLVWLGYRCVYMAHVCFYVWCTSSGVEGMLCVCVGGGMNVVFSV